MLKNCRICSSKDLELVLDLGNQPWCNNFLTKSELGKEKYYPLALIFCNKCSLVQLNYTVKKEIMFSDHTYLSGVTNSLSAHFKDLRDEVIKKFKIKTAKTILDIGSNDGTFLKHFKAIKWKVLGVEPAKRIAKIANKTGIKTLNKFFNFSLAKKINKKFDFINASGVFFHLEELHSVTKGIEYLMKKDGIFIIQFLYMKSIIENTAFDQIYHEHLLYYNLKTLNKLLKIHGLEIFDAKLSNIHGGQMTAYVCKKGIKNKTQNLKKYVRSEISSKINKKETYKKFSNKINLLKKINIDFINKSIKQNKTIYGLGAPAKGNTLLNYFGITKHQIKKLIEINPLRRNLFSPGSHIPIFLEKDNKQIPDIYYVLAWNFKEEILKKNQQLIKKGVEFYFPIKVKKKT